MKIHYATMAFLAGVSVAFSSCVAPNAGYVSYSAPGGISTGVAWTNASYDADGFPIFGYSYGRPVYGYTAAGAAIFTIAALTALCYVPHWGPASWYHGHYHYPSGIHRVQQPPRYPAGHAPHVRPPAGAHTGPGMPKHAVQHPSMNKPGPPHWNNHKPGNVAPAQPHWNNHKPGNVAPAQPHWNNHKLGNAARPPQSNAGGNHHPMGNAHKGGIQTLPTMHKVGNVPSAAQPSKPNGGIATLPARPSAPVASVPMMSGASSRMSAPAGMNRSHASGGFHGSRHGGSHAVGKR